MISILIPIYNGIEFLPNAISSIKSQTFIEWEVIIGINGHKQNSNIYKQAKIFESNKIKVFDFYQIKGKPLTLNEMIKECKYNWCSLLDVDDEWLPNKLKIQIKYIKDYDIIGTNCKYFGEKTGSPKIPNGNITNYNFKILNPIINSSVLLKKELCFWNNISVLEDYDLWLRLRKQNKKFFNCKEILVKHRIHKKSAFNTRNDQKNMLKKLRNLY